MNMEEFISKWEGSTTVDEAVAAIGLNRAVVLARASAYRARGVKLKKLKGEIRSDKRKLSQKMIRPEDTD